MADTNTILLLHCDSFYDSSPIAKGCAIAYGTPTLSTSPVKFGTSSFNGTGLNCMKYAIPNNTLSGAWTLDWWEYWTGGGINGYIQAGTDGSGSLIIHPAGTVARVSIYLGNTSWALTAWDTGVDRVLNTWTHIAIVCNGSTITAYQNGVAKNSVANTSIPTLSDSYLYFNGRYTNNGQYSGSYLDEFRLSNIARWTSNFTPPTAPYVDSAIDYPRALNTGSSLYGSASSTYSWYVQWYQYPTNTSSIYSYFDATIYAPTPVSNGVQVPINIANYDGIYRVGTSGYTAPTFTYKSLPTISIYNIALNQSIVIYNSEISTTVAAGRAGETTSGSITHSAGVYPIVPYTWFEPANSEWKFIVSEVVTIVDTTFAQTNTYTGASFTVPPVFNVTVRYADALYKAKNIWVRYNDSLSTVKTLKAKNS